MNDVRGRTTWRRLLCAVAPLALLALLPATAAAVIPVVSSINADFETGLAPFTGHIQVGVAGDSSWMQSTAAAHSGTGSAYGPGKAHVTDNWLTSNEAIAVPAGNTTAKLSFFHAFSLETPFDGALIERAVDGGAFGDFAPAEFLAGPPTTTISNAFGNPIGGRLAWTGVNALPAPFIHTVVDLSAYQGHFVQLRFRLGTDSSTNSAGWWVDDVDAALSPEATTGDASSVTTTAASIAGAVNPHSTQTSFHVEYGPTSAYGAVAPAADEAVGNDAGSHPVSQALTGLAPATTYHYRVVAAFAGGSVAGTDKTFTTAAAPLPDPPATPVIPATFSGMVLHNQIVKPNKRGKVKLTLACPVAAIGKCIGTDRLKRRTLTLGKSAFSIAPGKTGTVTITLSKAARKLLARKHAIKAKRTVIASDSRNARKTTTGAVTLKRR